MHVVILNVSCIRSITFIVFVLSALALGKKYIWCLMVLYMVAVLTVLRLAPVEAENKPLTVRKKSIKQQLKYIAFLSMLIESHK